MRFCSQRLVLGKHGRGPGESRSLSAVCLTHCDTAVVYDSGVRRVTILPPTGGVNQFPTTEGRGGSRDSSEINYSFAVFPNEVFALIAELSGGRGRLDRRRRAGRD